MKKKIIITLGLFFLAGMANAQEFEMVNDCNPGSGDGTPRYITEYNGQLIFNALESSSSYSTPTWNQMVLRLERKYYQILLDPILLNSTISFSLQGMMVQ